MNNLLLEHFDELISMPDDVEKLNRSILQLAMQGKLVSQDSKDDTADALLNTIPQEKRISLSPVFDKEKSFDIPSNWKWIRLEEIAVILMGQSPPGTSYNETGEGVPLINGPVEFGDGAFAKTRETKFTTAPTKMCKEGDLLVCVRGSTTGRTNISGFDACIGRGVAAIRSRYDYQGFLNYFMLYYRDSFYNLGTGSTFPSVSSDKIQTIPVPLPPLAEQRRIVARVEELFAQTRRLAEELLHSQTELDRLNESALARLLASETQDEFNERWGFIAEHFDLLTSAPEHIAPLRQSILELAVRGKLTQREAGDESAKELLKRIKEEKNRKVKSPQAITDDEKPFHLPAGWEWVRINSIADIGTGSTPLTTRLEYYENGNIPWVTSSATNKPFINKAEKHITEIAQQEMRLRLYPVNTLIVALYGQGKTRGQVSELMIPATINQACATLVFNGEASGVRIFAKLFFMKNYNELRAMAEGGAQPNLNVGKVSNMVLPIPPLAEQERIVKRVEGLLGWCDALEAQLKSAEDVRGRLVESLLSTVGVGK